uniref:RING-type domain-containing protein n=2 Tax=Ditylum brightwellii TaxID=49249 RepID=A0A7S4VGY6_9STRA
MTNQRVDILRYLVVDKGICIYDNVKDLKTSLGALEAVLNVLPAPGDFDYYLNERNRSGRGSSNEEERIIMAEAMGHESLAIVPSPSSSRLTQFALDLRSEEQKTEEDESKLASTSVDSTTVPDACILCYENTIDCVITPCGHQICCLKCSENLSTCPVCNAECQFIKVFKP